MQMGTLLIANLDHRKIKLSIILEYAWFCNYRITSIWIAQMVTKNGDSIAFRHTNDLGHSGPRPAFVHTRGASPPKTSMVVHLANAALAIIRRSVPNPIKETQKNQNIVELDFPSIEEKKCLEMCWREKKKK